MARDLAIFLSSATQSHGAAAAQSRVKFHTHDKMLLVFTHARTVRARAASRIRDSRRRRRRRRSHSPVDRCRCSFGVRIRRPPNCSNRFPVNA